MAYGQVNADVIGTSVAGSNLGAGNASIMKNRLINSAMVIDQRNAGGSVTPTADTYTLDRFLVSLTQSSKFSVQQNAGSVTPPAGFTNYLGITSLSAYSITSTDVFYVKQAIEGYNIADLAWGTVDAKTVTVSFWVRSSLTGTFGGAIRRGAGNIYVYPFTYSIPVANTWTQISVTITPPTSVWNSNTANGVGLNLILGLGIGATYSGTSGSWQASDIYGATGATSVVGTSGATFYITGVQLEVGTTATNFDTRSYGTELALCQRYYYQINAIAQYAPFGSGYSGTTTSFSAFIPFPVTMRTRPTGIVSSSASSFYVQNGVANYTPSAISYGNASANMANIAVGISATTVGQGGQLFDNAAGNSYIGFNGAEL